MERGVGVLGTGRRRVLGCSGHRGTSAEGQNPHTCSPSAKLFTNIFILGRKMKMLVKRPHQRRSGWEAPCGETTGNTQNFRSPSPGRGAGPPPQLTPGPRRGFARFQPGIPKPWKEEGDLREEPGARGSAAEGAGE